MKNKNLLQKKILLSFLFILFLFGCKSKNEYIYSDVSEIKDSFKVTDTLIGENTGINYLGTNNIYSFDSLLLICTQDPSDYFIIVNPVTNLEICKLCPKGRAKNELTSPINDYIQIFRQDNTNILYIPENESAIKAININESIDRGYAVIDSVYKSESFDVIQTLRLKNNKWFDYHLSFPSGSGDGTYSEPKFIVRDDSEEFNIKLFDKVLDPYDSYLTPPLYRGVVRAKPDGNSVIYAMTMFPYLNFFDIKEKTVHSFHERNGAIFEGQKDLDYYLNLPIAFIDVDVTNDYIFALSAGCAEKEINDSVKFKLNVYNWDGDKIYSCYFDKQITRIAYNLYTNSIFGLCNESIYEYVMPQNLSNFK